ncbi:unnamed protein product [Staurois parvus]|uniref:Transposase n=1 Tax=Staurois parvus TaxID=386267 RepID=A0ABN9HS18_9NEOB|nr:unnamed protein product [Staurois parvus]
MRRRYRGPWQIRGLAAAREARNLPAPYDKKWNTPAVCGDLKVAHGRVWRWRQQQWEAARNLPAPYVKKFNTPAVCEET